MTLRSFSSSHLSIVSVGIPHVEERKSERLQRTSKLVLSIIPVKIPLVHLPSHVRIMTELAFAPFVAVARLEERAQHRLWVDPERHLLHLHGLDQRRFLLAPLLILGLFFGAQLLLPLFGDRLPRLACDRCLRLDLGALLLHLGRFVFLCYLKRASVHVSEVGSVRG